MAGIYKDAFILTRNCSSQVSSLIRRPSQLQIVLLFQELPLICFSQFQNNRLIIFGTKALQKVVQVTPFNCSSMRSKDIGYLFLLFQPGTTPSLRDVGPKYYYILKFQFPHHSSGPSSSIYPVINIRAEKLGGIQAN